NFTSIYWAYATGFPKAANISKLVDKRNGKPQRDIQLEEYLKKKIKETHPYDVPEIAEVDVTSINKSYLNWLIESTN
ncbi:MAG: divalent cation tolerance protein CutA, partial [Nitrosopumilus sp.]